MIYAPKSRSVSNWYGFGITSKIQYDIHKTLPKTWHMTPIFFGISFLMKSIGSWKSVFVRFLPVSLVLRERERKKMFQIALASFRNICSKYSRIVEQNWGNWDSQCQAMLAIRQWTMWFDILIGWIIMCVALNLGRKVPIGRNPKNQNTQRVHWLCHVQARFKKHGLNLNSGLRSHSFSESGQTFFD